MDQDLQTESNRLANQLWEQLRRYYPQMLNLSRAADEPWLWDLLEIAPLPGDLPKLKLAKVKAILRAHRIRRLTAEQVLEQLRRSTAIFRQCSWSFRWGVWRAPSPRALGEQETEG